MSNAWRVWNSFRIVDWYEALRIVLVRDVVTRSRVGVGNPLDPAKSRTVEHVITEKQHPEQQKD